MKPQGIEQAPVIKNLDGSYQVGSFTVPPNAAIRIQNHLHDLAREKANAAFLVREEFDALMMYGSADEQRRYLTPYGGQAGRRAYIAMNKPGPPIEVENNLADALKEAGFMEAWGFHKSVGMFPQWLLMAALELNNRERRFHVSLDTPSISFRDYGRGLGNYAFLAAPPMMRRRFSQVAKRALDKVGGSKGVDRAAANMSEDSQMHEPWVKWVRGMARFSYAMGETFASAENRSDRMVGEARDCQVAMRRIARATLRAFTDRDDEGLPTYEAFTNAWGARLTYPRMGEPRDMLLEDPQYGFLAVNPWTMCHADRADPSKYTVYSARILAPATYSQPPLVYTKGAERRVAHAMTMPSYGQFSRQRFSTMVMSALTTRTHTSRPQPLVETLRIDEAFVRLYPGLRKLTIRVRMHANEDKGFPSLGFSSTDKGVVIHAKCKKRQLSSPEAYWREMWDPLDHNVRCLGIAGRALDAFGMVINAIDRHGGFVHDPGASLAYASPAKADLERIGVESP